LPEIAADCIRRRVAVIAAAENTLSAPAAKAATNTFPIIFSVGGDPVPTGLVRSLNQPGGNLTGYTEVNTEVWSNRLELLRTLAPTAARFGALDYPGNPVSEVVAKETRAAAEAIGLPVEILSVNDDAGLDAVLSNLAQKRVETPYWSVPVHSFIPAWIRSFSLQQVMECRRPITSAIIRRLAA
jgi:putative ABC transport system substrate-binding protein